MATNDFLPFAGAAGANVITQAVYAALAAQQTGFQSGVANSAQLNKVWRQSSIMSAVLAQFISDRTGQNATDDGTTATLLANLKLSAAALNGDQTQNFSVAPATQSQHAVQLGQVRKLLTANLTIYVATTGSDTTGNGSSGNPFATLQKAYSYIQQTYDLNGFIVTIQVANGTYTSGLTGSGPLVGSLGVTNCVVQGNTGSPSSVVINVGNSANCFSATRGGQFTIQGFTLQGGTASNCVFTNDNFSQINVKNGIVFGAASGGSHLNANSGTINVLASYTISGGASLHAIASNPGSLVNIASGITVTITGTPAFSTSFVNAGYLGMVTASGVTWSGSATGSRYGVTVNGVVNSGSGGANYFPGNAAGATATGGQYI